MTSVLLRNGYVVTVDPERRVFPNGYVHVDGERIAAVGPMDQLAPTVADEVDQVLDLDGKLVIPGLINLHDHHWASSFKGFDEGEEMESWLFSHVIPAHGVVCLVPGERPGLPVHRTAPGPREPRRALHHRDRTPRRRHPPGGPAPAGGVPRAGHQPAPS
jgi:hypothetical protein